jgi:hypothetical protein
MSLLSNKKYAFLIILLGMNICPLIKALSSLSRNDPFPVYTTFDPHLFLYTFKREELKGHTPIMCAPQCVTLNATPFGQNANQGKNNLMQVCELGDINGRWSTIGLLEGSVTSLPKGQTLPPTLQTAYNFFYPSPLVPTEVEIDPNQQFGFFSIPLEYRKRGVRFELSAQIFGDLGITVQGGFCDICQSVGGIPVTSTTFSDSERVGFIDLTPLATQFPSGLTNPNFTIANVQQQLTDKIKTIAQELKLDIGSFRALGMEDIRGFFYWRHAYPINRKNKDFALFLLIPFFAVGGSVAIGEEKPTNQPFALSFGNNGSNSIGGRAGINFDFAQTIEAGFEVGFTHFTARSFSNFRVPNSELQSGIYPFATDVAIHPGSNMHMGLKLSAYHFIDMLSFHGQYIFVDHRDDRIELKTPDPAFRPDVLENRSAWRVQVFNLGFNYDLSPNIALGFLYQMPTMQRNAYRSTSLMLTLDATF